MGPAALAACTADGWSPVIGDPSALGWSTVAAYALAAILCAAAAVRTGGRVRAFWILLAAILAMLCLNKQLDLQSALTEAGRCLARAQGWYAERGGVQLRFILGVAAICVATLVAALWTMRREVGRVWLALTGFALLLAFVGTRAASFHHVDRFIGLPVGPLRVNGVMELGGIALIALGAAAAVRRGARTA